MPKKVIVKKAIKKEEVIPEVGMPEIEVPVNQTLKEYEALYGEMLRFGIRSISDIENKIAQELKA
jgi:hypothetical protein